MSMTPEQAYAEALRRYQSGEPEATLQVTISLARALPGNPSCRMLHGLALALADRPVEARDELEAALSIIEATPELNTEQRGTHQRVMVELAFVLADLRQTDRALELSERATQTDDASSGAAAAHARALLGAGRASEAAEVVRPWLIGDASEADPVLAAARVALEGEGSGLAPADVIEHIEPLVKQVGHPTRVLRQLLRALADLLHAEGRCPDAFVAYRRAANLAVMEFDQKQYADAVRSIMTHWTGDVLAKIKRADVADESPVFVVGLAGAGADSIGRILRAHPRGDWAGRTRAIGQMAERFLDAKNHAGVPVIASPTTVRSKACEQGAEIYLRRARKRVLNPDADRIADTQHDNAPVLGLTALMFPGARIVCVRRDPAEACIQAYCRESSTSDPYTGDPVTLATHAHGTSRLLDHWREHLARGPLATPWLDVDHARLLAEPEAVAREVIEFTGLGWDDACADAARREAKQRVLGVDQYARHFKQLLGALGPLAGAHTPG